MTKIVDLPKDMKGKKIEDCGECPFFAEYSGEGACSLGGSPDNVPGPFYAKQGIPKDCPLEDAK